MHEGGERALFAVLDGHIEAVEPGGQVFLVPLALPSTDAASVAR